MSNDLYLHPRHFSLCRQWALNDETSNRIQLKTSGCSHFVANWKALPRMSYSSWVKKSIRKWDRIGLCSEFLFTFSPSIFAVHFEPIYLQMNITFEQIELQTCGCCRFEANITSPDGIFIVFMKMKMKQPEFYLTRVVHLW